ncbi:hypothetical protein FA10DRAFT_287069 [Acaromyces ingoldii]|uniref:SCP domain-containing protein n=1 Tax=Acaromyces ingoldii TaxID=215250 RepID=A0A316YIC3_9BASI|nr:hypothetical protein FA10DRAFT_287069 [Acaromyces ingoldii]PWN89177.1 hypothetical protein FA10DRAFT_287069 [Acaromyces ingoldii]
MVKKLALLLFVLQLILATAFALPSKKGGKMLALKEPSPSFSPKDSETLSKAITHCEMQPDKGETVISTRAKNAALWHEAHQKNKKDQKCEKAKSHNKQ